MAQNEVALGVRLDGDQAQKDLKKFSSTIDKNLGNVQKDVDKFSNSVVSSFKTIGATFLAAFAAQKIVSGIRDSIALVSDFSLAMNEVKTIVPDVSRVNQQFSKSLIETAKQFGTGSREQAKTYYQIISAGITDSAKANEVLIASNKLAIGGLASVESAVDVLTTALNVYKTSNLSAATASDALFAAVRVGKTTVSELAGSIGKVLPISNKLGVSFQDTAGAVASLTAKGLPSTAEAVTGLRAIFAGLLRAQAELGKESKKIQDAFSLSSIKTKGLANALKDMNQAVGGSSEELIRLFGRQEAFVAFQSLASDGFQGLADSMDATTNSAGAANKAFETIENSLGFQINKLKENLSNVTLQLFMQGEGDFLDFIKSANRAVLDFGNFVKKNEENIKLAFESIGIAIDIFVIAPLKLTVATLKVLKDFVGEFAEGVGSAFDDNVKIISSGNKELDKQRVKYQQLKQQLKLINDELEETKSLKRLKVLMKVKKQIESEIPAQQKLVKEIAKKYKEEIKYGKKVEQNTQEVAKQPEVVAQVAKETSAEIKKVTQDNNKNILENFKKIAESVKNVGLDQAQILERNYKESLKIIDDTFKTGLIDAKKYNQVRLKLDQQYYDALQVLDDKAREEADKANDEALKNAIKRTQEATAQINKFLGGGVKSISKEIITTFAEDLIPGIGGLVGNAFEILSQDTEQFKKTLASMFSGEFLKNIARNVGVIGEELPNLINELSQAVVESIPILIKSLIKSITNPDLYKGIAGNAIEGVFEGLKSIFKGAGESVDEFRSKAKAAIEQSNILIQAENAKLESIAQRRSVVLGQIKEQEKRQAIEIANEAATKQAEIAKKGIQIELDALQDSLKEKETAVNQFVDARKAAENDLNRLLGLREEATKSTKQKELEKQTRKEKELLERAQSDQTKIQEGIFDLEFELRLAKKKNDAVRINELQLNINDQNRLLQESISTREILEAEYNNITLAKKKELGIAEEQTLEQQIATAKEALLAAQSQEKSALENFNKQKIAIRTQQGALEVATGQKTAEEVLAAIKPTLDQELQIREILKQKAQEYRDVVVPKTQEQIKEVDNLKKELQALTAEEYEIKININKEQEKIQAQQEKLNPSNVNATGAISVIDANALKNFDTTGLKEAIFTPITQAVEQSVFAASAAAYNEVADQERSDRYAFSNLASGGLVPSGFPNDTFPANLSSGELVVPRKDTQRLSNFLDRAEAEGFNKTESAPQPLTINLQIGESELAKVLLNLNRQGFRTA
jgi:TP901 family phage tail tape measure protein